MEYIYSFCRQKNAFLISFGIIACIYLIAFLSLPTDSIWISDEGNRLMSVQSYALTGSKDLPDPLAALTDIPSGVRSYPKPYFIVKNGAWRSAYSLFFPYLASFFYVPGAEFLLYMIPLCSGLITVLLTGLLCRELFKDDFKSILCMVLCALGTPVLFYSGTFLETTCASAFALASLYILIYAQERIALLPPWKILTCYGACGLLLGISILFREEGFVFALAMALAVMIYYFNWKRIFVMGLCGAIPVLSLFIYNYMDSGSIFGMHSVVYGSLGKPGEGLLIYCLKNYSFYVFLLCLASGQVWNLIFPWIFPAGIIGSCWKKIRTVVLCGTMGITFISCVLSNYWNVATAHGGAFIFQSLVDHLPLAGAVILCMGGLLFYGEKTVRFLAFVCSGCILITPLLLNHSQIGMFWGGRHFLNIVPILCILCFVILDGKNSIWGKSVKVCCAALMILSIGVSFCGYGVLKMKREFSASYVRALARPEVQLILTDVFFFPEEIAMLNRKKTILLLTEKDSLEQIIPLLKKNNIRNFHLVLGRQRRVLSNDSIRRSLRWIRLEPGERFSHRSFGFFEVQLFRGSML